MEHFLIASASGRAIAQSARNAGYIVDVFDHFGDWDLQKSVTATSSTEPQQTGGSIFSARDFRDLFRLVDLTKYRAAIIGGGLETRMDLVRRLEQQVPLLGCQSFQLDRLGSHECLRVIPDLVEMSGARWPVTLTAAPTDSNASKWLLKSLRGSGGNHVRPWSTVNPTTEFSTARRNYIYQRQIDGLSISALFAAQGSHQNVSRKLSNQLAKPVCQLIGCSQQLVGEPVFGASPFAYCGSIAPLSFPDSQRQVIERLGLAISTEFEIDGIFGIDMIANEAGFWLVDINPRIPASAELFERLASVNGTDSFSVFETHLDSCFGRSEMLQPAFSNRCLAKGILFCKLDQGLSITNSIFSQLEQIYNAVWSSTFTRIADIPSAGTQIAKSEPILTFFVEAESRQAAQLELFQFADQLNELIQPRADSDPT